MSFVTSSAKIKNKSRILIPPSCGGNHTMSENKTIVIYYRVRKLRF